MSKQPNIIERLEDPEMCIDAADDAIKEIKELRDIVKAVNANMKHSGYLSNRTYAMVTEYMKEAEA